MRKATMSPSEARLTWTLVTAMALVPLAGCTMVGDRLLGVGTPVSGVTSCVKDCNDTYKTLYQEEQTRHAENVEACQALPQPERSACLDAEGARHGQAMDDLGEAKIECQNGCHSQGSGAAG